MPMYVHVGPRLLSKRCVGLLQRLLVLLLLSQLLDQCVDLSL